MSLVSENKINCGSLVIEAWRYDIIGRITSVLPNPGRAPKRDPVVPFVAKASRPEIRYSACWPRRPVAGS